MTYSVKEIFYTLQGEGARAGRPAGFQAAICGPGVSRTVFVPFAVFATPILSGLQENGVADMQQRKNCRQ